MPILGTQSSLNASAYGFGGQSVSASASVTPTNLTEGTQITVTVTTEGIPDGTTLYYTISGTLGTITASDFVDNSLSGSFTINSNTGSFTKTVAADGVVEDGEAFVVQIRQNSITGPILNTTSSVYVQGSQSTGVGQIIPTVNGVEYWDFATNGNLILDGQTEYSYTAATNVRLKAFIWGQGGKGPQGGLGGYSYGTFQLSQGTTLYMRLNYGGGSAGPGSGSGASTAEGGGGLAGIFSSSTINQSNARLIAGGGGGGASSIGNCTGGAGGGPSGSSGQNSPNSQISSTGGGGGSQSSGGAGGTASGSYTKTVSQTDSNSPTEAGVYHVRSGGSNTELSYTGQASVTHTNTFDYNWSFNTPYNNSSYSVSASNAGTYQNISANGTTVPAGFYSVVDNKTSNGFRLRWFRNDDNSAINVRYHTITCSGERTTTSSQTISVSSNGSSGNALQGGSGGSGSTGFGYSNASGGGGGGAGYYGGGGGAGGNDYGDGSRASSGGGGGSGYVHSSVINGFTGGYASGSSHPDRGTAGNAGANSRIVLQGIFAFEYKGLGGNESYSVNVPASATTMTAKVWGAGGQGIGECPASGTGINGGNFSGGSGGYVEGTIPVTGGSTVSVWVGGSGAGSRTPSMAGSGAGDGGGFSGVLYNSTNLMIAGGGGGAGQASNGGYGGGNGSGGPGSGGFGAPAAGSGGTQGGGGGAGSGTGPDSASPGIYFSSSGYNAFYRNNGGDSGGSGTYQGKRGGGGGAGYYGGGGGNGSDGTNCSGGGGGGGSGIITGSWTNTVSYNGQTGTGGGRTSINSGDSNYVPGYGGSSQNGLVVLIFE